NDREQNDDACADRDDVSNARDSQRHQQRQGGFWTVRGGTECVESEDRDSGGRSYLFTALLRGGERLAEDDIENGHGLGTRSKAARAVRAPHATLGADREQPQRGSDAEDRDDL